MSGLVIIYINIRLPTVITCHLYNSTLNFNSNLNYLKAKSIYITNVQNLLFLKSIFRKYFLFRCEEISTKLYNKFPSKLGKIFKINYSLFILQLRAIIFFVKRIFKTSITNSENRYNKRFPQSIDVNRTCHPTGPIYFKELN